MDFENYTNLFRFSYLVTFSIVNIMNFCELYYFCHQALSALVRRHVVLSVVLAA